MTFALGRRAALLLCVAGPLAAQQPRQAASADVDRRVQQLLAQMTREEKFWQLFMIPGDLATPAHDYSAGIFGLQIGAADGIAPREAARAHAAKVDSIQRWFTTRSRHRIPIIPFDEALHGLMREGATVFPQAIALAATFDSTLVGRVHLAAARETRSRGIRMVLSPVVNLATDVRWGRVEETFGEDVHLTGVMGRAHVRAFEGLGIITTPKHFVANIGEGGRDSYPIDVSRRALEEKHFLPFRSLIDQTGARSVMTAYNSVDGSPATQSRYLLGETLKRDWGFRGFIISDAAATGGATVLHRTEASTRTATAHAFASGLDVVFQSSWPEHRPYLRAFADGAVPDAVIDSAVARVLRTKFALGLFDDTRIWPDSAHYWANHPEHRELAREAAQASLVLLENKHATLPLRTGLRRIAVIGAEADTVRLGGYSGPGIAPVTMLEGIRERAGSAATVRYAPGVPRLSPRHLVVPASAFAHDSAGQRRVGLRAELWDNNALTGAPRVMRTDAQVSFGWTLNSPAPGIPYDWYSGRWTGRVTVPEGGARLGVEGNDGYRLWVDGRLVVDRWFKRSYSVSFAEAALAPGSHEIRLEYFESTGNARLKLVWDYGVQRDEAARIAEAVEAARASEVAIVVVGIEEGEFRDRARLRLPGAQETLIRAVAATGTPTVVVIVGGSAVTMSDWLGDVGAVLFAWYPGEEGGRAVADVLFGDVSPSGRLPITFPLAEGQLPLTYDHKPTGRGDDYLDLSGQPLFPFGHGLSYTTFRYDSLVLTPRRVAPLDSVQVDVRLRVTNTGARTGAEVVQLYVRDVLTSVAQPLIALKGFTRVTLAPGESRTLQFTLGAEHLRLLNEEMQWVVEPGVFRVMVGASSKDIRLRQEITLP
ncbi:MAG: glycoside hydrolase family 3 C-terminal domain-containing protein [Gemmatimonadaceae bacterium]|nr:glycoside hydrolase family 3 C-terminal domain-containing protein [Gemmatimonadaceae bacterium]MCW5827644.1 glycoside hydrolase family 3 C-terminal domain-containing protein [Gemmatimonadaceae bacterium]